MNKIYYQSKLKSTGTTYLFWILLGAHYAYLNKWGIQLLFWVTLGGFGIWWLIDLFLIPGKVIKYNMPIFEEIEKIEKREKEEDQARNIAIMKAAMSNNNDK